MNIAAKLLGQLKQKQANHAHQAQVAQQHHNHVAAQMKGVKMHQQPNHDQVQFAASCCSK